LGDLPAIAATTTATVSTATTISATAAATISAAAAAVSTAATAAAAIFTGLSFVHTHVTAVVILTIEVLDGLHHCFFGVHCHEGKATGAVAIAVDWDMDIGHCAKLSKESPEFIFTGIKGEIPHVHFHRF
jgi:hypothetical protein